MSTMDSTTWQITGERVQALRTRYSAALSLSLHRTASRRASWLCALQAPTAENARWLTPPPHTHTLFSLSALPPFHSAALPPLPLPIYGQNLLTIYKRLQTKCKQVMWTSTTPVPDVPTSYGRTYELPIQYNAEALRVLTPAAPAGKLLVNDLWSAMIKFCGDHYKSCLLQLPANVHLTEAGINFTAHSAAADILAALG